MPKRYFQQQAMASQVHLFNIVLTGSVSLIFTVSVNVYG